MGVLINGEWRDEELPVEYPKDGEFKRIDSAFRDRITADGLSGFPAEARRYHLYVAHNCPWAHRTLIFRALKKLDRAITVAYAIPGLREQGWAFESDPNFPDCTPDTVNGFRYLHQAYTASDPHYTGKVTVPTLWDTKTGRIVNNESSEIIRMFNSEFRRVAGDDTDFSAYEAAYDALFAALDELEARLARQRYLVGNRITEADWRLVPTLLRFDVAYFSLFKCNRQRIADYPNLSNYMRELYAVPGIAETVKPRYYVIGYYSIRKLNPTGIIPKGTPIDLSAPHDRARLAA